MNYIDKQYLDIMRDIIEHGYKKQTRAGEVLCVFDRTMRFDLRDSSVPLLTTKKVFTKGCIYELLWFLKGDTNIKYLVDHNVNIWTDDAYRYYLELVDKDNNVYTSDSDGFTYTVSLTDNISIPFSISYSDGHAGNIGIRIVINEA